MSAFRVNSQVLRAKAAELEQLNANFKKQLEELVAAEIEMGKGYEGESRNTFHNNFEGNRAKFEAFYNGINQYIQTLKTEADNYEKAELQSTTIAQK